MNNKQVVEKIYNSATTQKKKKKKITKYNLFFSYLICCATGLELETAQNVSNEIHFKKLAKSVFLLEPIFQ